MRHKTTRPDITMLERQLLPSALNLFNLSRLVLDNKSPRRVRKAQVTFTSYTYQLSTEERPETGSVGTENEYLPRLSNAYT